MSAVTQNRPVKVEIKGFKTSHSLEVKTALVGPITAGLEGHVECPESEPANDDIQFSRSRMVSAPDCTRAWDQPRDRRPVFAPSRDSKTSHFDPRLGRGKRVKTSHSDPPALRRVRKQNRPFRPPAKTLAERVNPSRWPKLCRVGPVSRSIKVR